jgi:hypothetical protein
MGEVQGCLILLIGLTIIGTLALAAGALVLSVCRLLNVDVTGPLGLAVIIAVAVAVSIRPSLWIMDRIPMK